MEVILRKKYQWLIENEYMEPLSQEEIEAANAEEKEDHVMSSGAVLF
jgi:hypothetical protein